jgi:hypothetical protein
MWMNRRKARGELKKLKDSAKAKLPCVIFVNVDRGETREIVAARLGQMEGLIFCNIFENELNL